MGTAVTAMLGARAAAVTAMLGARTAAMTTRPATFATRLTRLVVFLAHLRRRVCGMSSLAGTCSTARRWLVRRSMLLSWPRSSPSQNDSAMPDAPARAVRPMRWT